MCAEEGVLVYHGSDSRRGLGAGFPDLVLVGHHGLLYAELKAPLDDLSTQQRIWRYRLTAAGQRWVLWRKADLDTGVIEETIREL
jgi:hypothetical protein